MKVLARLVFSWDDDLDGAIEELRRVGYTVHRYVGPDATHECDHVEAIIDGSADDKIMDAIWREVHSIVDRAGGVVMEILTVSEDEYVPFEWHDHQWKINFADH